MGSLGRASASPAARWRAELQSWALPDELLAAAPESPWHLPPALFAHRAAETQAEAGARPSTARALEVLRPGGVVLDVGAGAGAASLALAPPAALIVAVDEQEEMLRAFAAAAEASGAAHREIEGRWPDASSRAPLADVVVCHHVVYNVAEIVPFLEALTGHARTRVVVEMTRLHPMSDLSPLFRELHGLERPTHPTVDDFAEVLSELGYDFRMEPFRTPSRSAEADLAERVAFARRRLCVGPERDEEIEAFLRERGRALEDLVTLYWDRAGDAVS